MSKAKREMSATFNPWAECVGVADDTPCPVEWSFGESQLARDEAKRHAEKYPGHRLRVVVEKVDLYRATES
jgi:hypothetical protein